MTLAACNRQRLRDSLEDRLDESEEEALAAHLSHCGACRDELERLAGDPAVLSRICQTLKSKTASEEIPSESDHWPSASDFAVDFLQPATAPEAIGRLGDIDVLEVIGQGGMGIVLKGHQSELARLVAVKVLAPHLAVSGPARQRFSREAQATAAIVHPNVMPILTVHPGGKLPYLVMPYLACESLQQRIDRGGPLELVDVLRIGMQAAKGLAAAHAQGIVHRDVKPANILLEKGVERVMLTDFGLARAIDDASITRSGLIAGTPQYMSPEQVRGESLDARSDLFSLGSVLYTMAAGRPPFRAETTYGILRRITDDTPRPLREINPRMPVWFESIVKKLHAKPTAERFQSANEVATILEECLAHVQQPTAAPLPREFRASVTSLNKRRAAIAAAMSVLLVLVFATFAILTTERSTPEAAPQATPGEKTQQIESGASDATTDWDAIAEEANELFQDASATESQAKRFWDRDPQSVPEPLDEKKE